MKVREEDHQMNQPPPRPYHRWPSNENIDRHPVGDRCLECGVWRYPLQMAPPSEREKQNALATGPCPGKRRQLEHGESR